MSARARGHRRQSDRMSDTGFRLMCILFKVIDFFYPYLGRRIRKFGLRPVMVVVDYGCGPGRYTVRFARIVGAAGMVYAVDIHELAIAAVEEEIDRRGLTNVRPLLAHGYDSGVPDCVADAICAIDMFFSVSDSIAFLAELRRIVRADGVLIIDDGHQPRAVTRERILASGFWTIVEETRDHLKCRPAGP
jgi:ubiquinone/menaquinone biosynthesis C-methylase UbiE